MLRSVAPLLRVALALLTGLLPLTAPPPAACQSAGTKKPPKSSKTKTKTANVKTGTLVSLDADNFKVRIKTATETLTYALTEKTRYLKERKDAAEDNFKAGEEVVLKLRKVRNKPEYAVFEMTDETSYNWLTGLRKNAVTALIKEMGDDTLAVTVEGNAITYTVSEKTRWNKNGKEASAANFKAGDTVTIVPRSLPGGNIMARAVADNAKDAELAKQAGSSLLSGVFKSLNTTAHTITLVMEGAETRTVPYNDATEVRMRSKKSALSALKSGQHLIVHLYRPDDNDNAPETASRITIEVNSPRPKKP